MGTDPDSVGFDIFAAARKSMLENGFIPDFPPEVEAELGELPRRERGAPVRDLRHMLWSSIDNPESKDLDQLEVTAPEGDGRLRVLIAIADVDLLVPRGSLIDRHAEHNTTSVYTGVTVFPMLPEALSTDLTSLNPGVDRRAVITDMVIDAEGEVASVEVYRALVHNHAKLSYDEVGAWLEDRGPEPAAFAELAELRTQLRAQDEVAQRLRALRHRRGALELETIEARPVAEGGKVVDLELTHKSRARELVEDFMIAANGAVARFLESRGIANVRRVVKAPERWERLVTLAAELGDRLPGEPSSMALAEFLRRRKAAAPETFADLSLSVVKLMGPGEYAVERPGEAQDGHFGLAAQDYTHSTAPNRRYADLLTQRLIKAALAGDKPAYDERELEALARRITERENAAKKVERQMRKVAAALLLSERIGDEFESIVTGVTPKGTFVRLLDPPAEGRVVRGAEGLDVGDRVRVELVDTAPARGFIDFARALP